MCAGFLLEFFMAPNLQQKKKKLSKTLKSLTAKKSASSRHASTPKSKPAKDLKSPARSKNQASKDKVKNIKNTKNIKSKTSSVKVAPSKTLSKQKTVKPPSKKALPKKVPSKSSVSIQTSSDERRLKNKQQLEKTKPVSVKPVSVKKALPKRKNNLKHTSVSDQSSSLSTIKKSVASLKKADSKKDKINSSVSTALPASHSTSKKVGPSVFQEVVHPPVSPTHDLDIGVNPGLWQSDEVFDETDQAQYLQLVEQADIHLRVREMNKPIFHPDFDGLHCVECDIEIPAKRLASTRCVRCVDCQELFEKIQKKPR